MQLSPRWRWFILGNSNIHKNGTGTKRSSTEFQELLKEVFHPHKPPIQKETSTQLGFIINFVHDKDANFIFNQQFKSKLAAKNMTAELSTPSCHDREVYLIDVPPLIFNKSIPDITGEIVRLTRHRSLEVKKNSMATILAVTT